MLQTRKGHPSEPVPVSSYCASSKNEPDLEAEHDFSALWLRLLLMPLILTAPHFADDRDLPDARLGQ